MNFFIDLIQESLMCSKVSCDQTKIICIGSSFSLFPNLELSSKNSKIGLKAINKTIGLKGSPWKTPLLNVKLFDLNLLV